MIVNVPKPNFNIDPYTVLLMHMNGADNSTNFLDATGKVVTVSGGAKISTAQSKFGGASGSFNQGGTSDYLTLADSSDWRFDANNFTIESWLYLASNNIGFQIAIEYRPDNISGFTFCVDSNNAFALYTSTTGAWSILNSGFVPATNTWYHVAVVRDNTSIAIYVNGIYKASISVSGAIYNPSSSPLRIGHGGAFNYTPFKGYIDELRISKGIARWTSNFAPPTKPYSY